MVADVSYFFVSSTWLQSVLVEFCVGFGFNSTGSCLMLITVGFQKGKSLSRWEARSLKIVCDDGSLARNAANRGAA